MRDRTEEEYRRDVMTLGTVLSEQTSRYLEGIDVVLHGIQNRTAVLDIRTPAQFHDWLATDEARALLKADLQNLAQVAALFGVDATGRLVVSTHTDPTPATDFSARGYFRHFAEQNDPAPFISTPSISKFTGVPTTLMVHRVNAPDGTFLGVVAAVIDVSYLNKFYQVIGSKPGQAVTLLRKDGLIVTRVPDPTDRTGQMMPKDSPWYDAMMAGGGTYLSPGYLTGYRALVSVHPLRNYPLVVDVSILDRVALAAWRHQAMLLGIAGLTAAAGFALLFGFIALQFRRQEAQNTALRQVTHDLQASEQRAAQESDLLGTTLNHMDQGLIMITGDDTVAICNRRALELLDLPPAFMANNPKWQDLLSYQWSTQEFEHSDEEFQDFVRRSALLEGPLVYDRQRPNGRYLEVRTTPLPGGRAVRTYTDITNRKLAENRIEFLAHHDALTGLANRTLLNDRLSHALTYAARADHSLAVLALDLDRFKEINDAYGHGAGDDVLVQVAERLTKAVRATDTVARIGGDEFVVIQIGITQPSAAIELAQRLVGVLSQPFDLAGNQVTVGTSLGIALYPSDGETAAELLTNVDIALYRAKTDGSGVFRLFEVGMDQQMREHHALEHDLRGALGTTQLMVHFQPQFTCETRLVTGFEALLRWRHPVRGNVAPSVFIPIAEESKLITELGGWVLETACTAAMSWPAPLRVAVNLSAAQFRGDDLPGQVADVLRRTGLAAGRLELEVTETLLIDDTKHALAILLELKAMGVRIALDDFGTGYSSLSYLRCFPFDKIKIDQSFVQALEEDPNALLIVHAILAMGRSLGLDVIAEGVETEQQLLILNEQHCSEVQGFLLGRPISAADVGRNLDRADAGWPHVQPDGRGGA